MSLRSFWSELSIVRVEMAESCCAISCVRQQREEWGENVRDF